MFFYFLFLSFVLQLGSICMTQSPPDWAQRARAGRGASMLLLRSECYAVFATNKFGIKQALPNAVQ
jgi:hypothetical protein